MAGVHSSSACFLLFTIIYLIVRNAYVEEWAVVVVVFFIFCSLLNHLFSVIFEAV